MRVSFWNNFPLIFSLSYLVLAPLLSLSLLSSLLLLLAYVAVDRVRVLGRIGRHPYNEELVLETISVSHYAEKVRWAMDYLKIPYHEEQDAGILGIFLLGRRVPRLHIPSRGITIANSADILRYLLGRFHAEPEKAAFLATSAAALEWEQKLDTLGADIRVVVYNKLFNLNDRARILNVLWGCKQSEVPVWQRHLVQLLSPVLVTLVTNRLRVSPEREVECKRNAEAVFKEIDTILQAGNTFILGTKEPTYIDMHFAAMAALCLFPENYGGKVLEKDMKDKLVEFAGIVGKEFDNVRNSRAGQLVVNLYQNYRI